MLHGAYATADRKRFRLRNSLVTAQVALSLMLVVTALLFLRSLEKAATHRSRVHRPRTFRSPASTCRSPVIANNRPWQLADRFQERLKGIAGVESVAHARMIPLQGSGFGLGSLACRRRERAREATGRFDADWDVVSPGVLRHDRDADRRRPGIPRFRSRRRAMGGDHQRDLRAPGVARAVGDRPHGACSESMRDEERAAADRRRRARREVSLHQQSANAPFIYVPMAQQPQPSIEFYVRHAPGPRRRQGDPDGDGAGRAERADRHAAIV